MQVPVADPERAANRVLVAEDTLATGTFVRAVDLRWQPWPAEGLAKGYVREGERLIADFVGAVVRHRITAGQPVTASRVVFPGERGFMAAVLAPGMRAVSVPVNATSGVAGFVFPGDWVDVVLTMKLRPKDANGKGVTRYFSETLLSALRVLAIDQRTEQKDGEASVAKTATLEVTPKQAEQIALALEMGALSLSLHSLAQTDGGLARLAREAGIRPPAEAAAKSYTMDLEVNFAHDALFGYLRRGRGGKRQVNVLRGDKSELAKF